MLESSSARVGAIGLAEAWLAQVMVACWRGRALYASTAPWPRPNRPRCLPAPPRGHPPGSPGRDLHLRIDADWPWHNALDTAFSRLRTALY
ncbi:MAG: hypothetical protein LC749_21250 [Actinobacteria bacterium]|nr:hypothetical protein [Actinomycetota bacterium]